ncbi:hypothetical protein AWC38_SpisGene25424 [Stylophora pistillata]|uniref:Uncharacterized protein n=1 Tax=Stylophora pistillata TaxID=50429 RepID=A0A2B4R3L3_STYPI|nr:hypothetical protein AWC38_SpisGene25424 [Stylophora pistillata]
MEMTTNEQKRWMVVGIVMVEVIAPVMPDVVKQGMMSHYNQLDTILCPCKLNALTFADYRRNPSLKDLKFENINNNSQTHGKDKNKNKFNVSSELDLAELYLPDYLTTFSAFDESLDFSAILRLLGYSKTGPIFQSPDPMLLIQTAADTVRDHVRNKWAHAYLNEWTETFFNDCFTKFENLVKSVGNSGKEKSTLDQQAKLYYKNRISGCEIVMPHAVDQQLLNLVQQTYHWRTSVKNLKLFNQPLPPSKTNNKHQKPRRVPTAEN